MSFLIVIEFLSPISSVYSNKLSLYYLNMCHFFTLIMNSEFRGSKTKYEIANYFPDGVTGKFVISGRYCCVPDVNIHLIKPHLKFSLHLFYRRTFIF